MTETPTAITLTDNAASKIKDLLDGQDESDLQALRVAVRGGGCSGFQYALAFDQVKDDDHVFEDRGVRRRGERSEGEQGQAERANLHARH